MAPIIEKIDAPALARIVRLLELSAGDPNLAERGVLLSSAVAVSDSAVQTIAEAANNPGITYSTALIQFSAASGLGRYDVTGGFPTASGSRGLQIPSGGGTMTIRGADNIRNFKVIAETGNTMEFTYMLFQTSVFGGIAR